MADEIVSGVVNHAEGKRTFHFRKGSSDEGVVKQIFAAGEYDLMRLHRHTEILEFLQKQSARGLRPMIVDAGANIGASAVFFALTYPSALVIAIEPEEQNYALLRRNVEGLDVQCIQGALAATAGYARLADPGLGNWGFRTEPTTGNGVPCITVSDLYAQRPAQTFPYIVKIDIEGGEAGLFDDAAWLAETPLVIIEPHDWLMPKAGTFRSFLRCIADQNRDFVIRGENIFSIRHEL
jgi:FkbM family methyltransferase